MPSHSKPVLYTNNICINMIVKYHHELMCIHYHGNFASVLNKPTNL